LLAHASWSFNGSELFFYLDSSYGADAVRQELTQISAKLSQKAGKEIPISIIENVPPEGPSQESTEDATISMLQHLFRGEIISGGSHESK